MADNGSGWIGQPSRRHMGRCMYNRLDTGSHPFVEEHANRWVREDKGFYIPDFLSKEYADANPEGRSAAADHAKHLLKAERLLGQALNLIGLLLAALDDKSDTRTMQIETGLKVIETRLRKAYNRLDKHDSRHTNLFLAYFELKGKTDQEERN